MKLVTMGEAEVNFPSLLDEAQNDRVVVERNGQPLGVILSMADYQDWTGMREEELTTLFSSREVQDKIRRAESDLAEGRTLSHEEVGRRLRARGGANG